MHKFLLNGRQDSDGAAANKKPTDEDEGGGQAACQINEADICLEAAARFEEQMSCDVHKGNSHVRHGNGRPINTRIMAP